MGHSGDDLYESFFCGPLKVDLIYKYGEASIVIRKFDHVGDMINANVWHFSSVLQHCVPWSTDSGRRDSNLSQTLHWTAYLAARDCSLIRQASCSSAYNHIISHITTFIYRKVVPIHKKSLWRSVYHRRRYLGAASALHHFALPRKGDGGWLWRVPEEARWLPLCHIFT